MNEKEFLDAYIEFLEATGYIEITDVKEDIAHYTKEFIAYHLSQYEKIEFKLKGPNYERT